MSGKEDTVARLGSEFTVILTDAKQKKEVELVLQTIINTIELPFDLVKKTV